MSLSFFCLLIRSNTKSGSKSIFSLKTVPGRILLGVIGFLAAAAVAIAIGVLIIMSRKTGTSSTSSEL